MRQKTANLQLLDILACNSASKPSFQNPTKSACPILKRWYNNKVIDQNIQKCCKFASCIARILNVSWMTVL